MDYRDGTLFIGGVPAMELAERWGTPLYVYDAGVIDQQAVRLRNAFAALPFRPFYAIKANGSLAILARIRAHGFGCDVVSPGEVFLARRAGFQPDEMWFTCSAVSDEDLEQIDDARIVINVNSMSEVDRVLRLDLPNPIALRVNPPVGAGHHHDVITAGNGVKFGIDVAEIESARMVVEDSGRQVVGLHSHIGSGIHDLEPLLESAKNLLEVSIGFQHLRWLNFGGGISVPYQPGEQEFPLDRYGQELAKLAGKLLRARDLTAILEPGRFLVAPAGVLLTRVTASRISGGQRWLGVDSGFNHLLRPSKYGAYHHIVNASRGSDGSLLRSFDRQLKREEVIIAGNLCESGDVFTRDRDGHELPRAMEPTAVGDLLAICDTGAYGFSMASHYNARLLPPEVLVEQGSARLVRERQPMEDLLRGQTL